MLGRFTDTESNMTDNIAALQAQLDALQAQVNALREQEAAKPDRMPTEKDIGRLVEGWLNYPGAPIKTGILAAIDRGDRLPFLVGGEWCHHARLVGGPTRPNMYEWGGGECPVAPDQLVIFQWRSGYVGLGKARKMPWLQDGSSHDIIAYSSVEMPE
jgi:hypothetical protein